LKEIKNKKVLVE